METLRVIALQIVLVALFAVAAQAQQVQRYVDFSGYGWGTVEIHLIDTDGIISTNEWAVKSTDPNRSTYNQWRVVAERNGRMCVGAWFSPTVYGPGVQIISPWFRSRMIVTSGWDASRFYEILLLSPPPC
jgi:hypothetical protein